ncbi:MAG: hypothetical protein E7604_05925 [Ruminococcaceae bacterium]|nr:hypothetical protein [Oscillospiraceae bacterium]
MNHSPTLGLHIRRVLHPPMHAVTRVHTQKHGADDPIVIRRTYDISAECGRQKKDGDTPPVVLHFRGEKTTPLLRCAAIGMTVIGAAAAIMLFCRIRRDWQLRRRYARRYAERLKNQRLRMKHRETASAPLEKPDEERRKR